MLIRSMVASALLLSAALAPAVARPAPPAVKAPSDVCAAMRKHMAAKPAAPAAGAGRPLSQDSKDVLTKIASMGEGGSAAPNAQAQAMLNMMAGMLASRSDAESQASAALLRQQGARPGANSSADLKALGC